LIVLRGVRGREFHQVSSSYYQAGSGKCLPDLGIYVAQTGLYLVQIFLRCLVACPVFHVTVMMLI